MSLNRLWVPKGPNFGSERAKLWFRKGHKLPQANRVPDRPNFAQILMDWAKVPDRPNFRFLIGQTSAMIAT